jgi:hypothetical protein
MFSIICLPHFKLDHLSESATRLIESQRLGRGGCLESQPLVEEKKWWTYLFHRSNDFQEKYVSVVSFHCRNHFSKFVGV